MTALSALSIEALKREISRITATAQRHSEAITRAAAEKTRIEQEQEKIKQDKEAGDARMKDRTHGTLASFTSRINDLLEMLCADFQLEELGTERSGGATGARFTLRVEAGCFAARLRRVTSALRHRSPGADCQHARFAAVAPPARSAGSQPLHLPRQTASALT